MGCCCSGYIGGLLSSCMSLGSILGTSKSRGKAHRHGGDKAKEGGSSSHWEGIVNGMTQQCKRAWVGMGLGIWIC